ncbi:type II secretion system protein [Candidatus Roizmanbacteria bacterium]|nr:type II secretion system protein [Candidatus Roizmanbacteria bacterium]
MNLFKKFSSKGFTLIELLIVITIIAALAVTVFVALNPAQRLEDARDARRTSDVDSILTAIHEYIVDNAGSYPTGLAANTPISQLGTGATGCSGAVGVCTIAVAQDACLNLTTDLAPYLKSIPLDPLNGTAVETQYAVAVDTNGIVTVTSCGTEGATTIEASR